MGCGASNNSAGMHFLIVPQKDSDEGKRIRQNQLTETRRKYEWQYSDWLPPCVKGIPQREKDREGAGEHLADLFVDLKGKALAMNFMKPANLLAAKFDCQKPFDLWTEIYPSGISRGIPTVSQRWRSDKEFGRQKLCGINPHMIKKFRPLAHFPVTDQVVQGVIPAGTTLDSLHAASRLYMVDYQVLEGVTGTATDTTWVTPIILFMVDNDKDLVPIAIQLQQNPSASPIFTPRDDPGLWQLVKWFCQSADGAIHQSVQHLLCTHLIMETAWVSARRNLALRHPIHELIDAHFWFTNIINDSSRVNLMVPSGELPTLYPQGYEGMKQLIRKFNHSWDWNKYHIPDLLKHHGTDDPNTLPKYYFRDDAMRLWPVVERYVTKIVDLTYREDKDVADDTELVNFAKEMQINTTWQNLPMTNGVFVTKAQLSRFLSMVIFTVSCTHAAVNNGQYDLIGYIPNYPPKLQVAAPIFKQSFTDQQLAAALPNYDHSVVQISFFHAVATPTDPARRLGQYHPGFMMELPGAVPVIRWFQRELETISKEIRQRNASIPVPYIYLDPAQIANGVAV